MSPGSFPPAYVSIMAMMGVNCHVAHHCFAYKDPVAMYHLFSVMYQWRSCRASSAISGIPFPRVQHVPCCHLLTTVV